MPLNFDTDATRSNFATPPERPLIRTPIRVYPTLNPPLTGTLNPSLPWGTPGSGELRQKVRSLKKSRRRREFVGAERRQAL